MDLFLAMPCCSWVECIKISYQTTSHGLAGDFFLHFTSTSIGTRRYAAKNDHSRRKRGEERLLRKNVFFNFKIFCQNDTWSPKPFFWPKVPLKLDISKNVVSQAPIIFGRRTFHILWSEPEKWLPTFLVSNYLINYIIIIFLFNTPPLFLDGGRFLFYGPSL